MRCWEGQRIKHTLLMWSSSQRNLLLVFEISEWVHKSSFLCINMEGYGGLYQTKLQSVIWVYGRVWWQPGEGNGTPLLPGKSHGQRSWVGCISMGSLRVGHDWATSLSRIGEGNGNPLQCSCLENPRDSGAWWAAVYGVAQSRTWMTEAT